MECNASNDLLVIVRELAEDNCEAVGAGWENCEQREQSQFMARGYRCRACRARDALSAALPGSEAASDA